MANEIYGNILPMINGIVQNVDPNRQVKKPAAVPVAQQQPTEPSVQATPANILKRNFFRKDPTPAQASVVGASTKSGAEVDAELMAQAQKTRPVPSQPVTYNINPMSETAGMDLLSSMYTSPEQEEKYRKASVANQRILAVADALRHIGNIYNTVNYAPAQKLNNPVQEEADRYQKGKALRDAANLRYLSYQQAKAAQDAKQKQWEADYNLKIADAARKAGYTEAQIKNMQDRLANQKAYQEGQLLISKQRADDAKALGEARIKETARHNKESERRGWATLNETKRHHGVIESKGGSKGNTVTLRGKNGFYSKNMDSAELNSFYNQTYNEMKRRGLIDEGKVLQGVPADIFGQRSVSQSAMKNAVDDALLRHPEVGKWLADEYEFEVDPRFENEEEQPQSSRYTPFQFDKPVDHDWSKKKPDNYGFGFQDMSGVSI